ncbi:hypothetical protein HHK36_029742 [Tetracentron sinense]|uniref:SHSP domain-containing protein n=1 Tax=Tetracentron sinense TaxID=13715 RepID=A0A835D2W4_TETSI|nr:hypothetical protein HHK36_029742 [Tetracentron sinense]
MENMRGRRGVGDRNNSLRPIYEDFQPSFDWTHLSNWHVLLLDLSGFKKEEVKLKVDNIDKVIASGERQLGDRKYSRFKEVYRVPKDSYMDGISGKFEGGLLVVIIPKKEIAREEEAKKQEKSYTMKDEKEQGHGIGDVEESEKNGITEGLEREREENTGLMKSVMKKLRKNKAIIITALLAISVGLYISHERWSRGEVRVSGL